MIKIDYPQHPFRITTQNEQEIIFDELRKVWVRLTPEEWVRQNFLQYLVQVMKYPPSLIAIEKEIHLGELKKRFDILVYDRNHKPWMMVECKEVNVKLDDVVLQQILRYNIALPVQFMVITNGSYCIGYEIDAGIITLIAALPFY